VYLRARALAHRPIIAHGGWRARVVRAFVPLALAALISVPGVARAQTPPDAAYPDLQPGLADIACPSRERTPSSEAERLRWEMRARYARVLPLYFAKVPPEADAGLPMPVEGVLVGQVADTWGAARSEGRSHEGTDIFAPAGTPVRSATDGFVYRIEGLSRGGNSVTVVGGGGRRYFYTHFSAFASELEEGQFVTPDTVLGYVGNSGNAAGTPPHLHFGVYDGALESCAWDAINPYPLLVDR
jgi:murein DD-endopeptidase MepM/ murein hydrolase activator NlpD